MQKFSLESTGVFLSTIKLCSNNRPTDSFAKSAASFSRELNKSINPEPQCESVSVFLLVNFIKYVIETMCPECSTKFVPCIKHQQYSNDIAKDLSK